jgi:hypothetical protein
LCIVKIVSHFKNIPIIWVLIVGMFHSLVLCMLHDCIFWLPWTHRRYTILSDFIYRLIINWLLWCVSSCLSGYVYFIILPYTLNCYNFFFIYRGYGISFHVAIYVSWCLVVFFSNLNHWQLVLILGWFEAMIVLRHCMPFLIHIFHHMAYNIAQVLNVYLYNGVI